MRGRGARCAEEVVEGKLGGEREAFGRDRARQQRRELRARPRRERRIAMPSRRQRGPQRRIAERGELHEGIHEIDESDRRDREGEMERAAFGRLRAVRKPMRDIEHVARLQAILTRLVEFPHVRRSRERLHLERQRHDGRVHFPVLVAFDLHDERVVRVVVDLEALRARRREIDVDLRVGAELRLDAAAELRQRRMVGGRVFDVERVAAREGIEHGPRIDERARRFARAAIADHRARRGERLRIERFFAGLDQREMLGLVRA